MRKILIYTGIFIVAVVVLELFVFDSRQLWIYLAPPVYIAFILLLPTDTKPIVMLGLGLLTGVFIDFFEGTGGLATIATLFTAYLRRYVIMLTLGKESVEEEWVPSPGVFGLGKFMRYVALAVMLHSLLYFSLEALTWRDYYLVLLKTAVSGSVAMLAVWLVALVFFGGARKKV